MVRLGATQSVVQEGEAWYHSHVRDLDIHALPAVDTRIPHPIVRYLRRLFRLSYRLGILKRPTARAERSALPKATRGRRRRCCNLPFAARHRNPVLSVNRTRRLRYGQLTGVVALTGRLAWRSWKVGGRIEKYRAHGWRLSQTGPSALVTCSARMQGTLPLTYASMLFGNDQCILDNWQMDGDSEVCCC